MKHLVNKIFIIPFLLLVFGFVSFGIYYSFFIEDLSQKEFTKSKKIAIEIKKQFLKIELQSIMKAINEIRATSYDLVEDTLRDVLNIMSKNYIHYHFGKNRFFENHLSKNVFFYIISKDYVYPKFYQKYLRIGKIKYLIVVYNNKNYLAVEKRLDKDTIVGIAFKLNIIDKEVKKDIFKYLMSINNLKSYIAVGEITDWFVTKGQFGKVVYHPLKDKIGKPLSTETTDIKGYHYQKAYFDCLKTKDDCFLQYYYYNPITKKIEKKLSYFVIYRPYNYVFVKGIYYSDILKNIDSVQTEIEKDAHEVLFTTLVLMLLFGLISFFFAYVLTKKIKNQILQDYKRLEDNYKKSKEELYNKIYYDKITSLPNKFKLLEDIKNYKSLVILDIEDFANINNIYGFEFGNEILKCIAGYLKKRFKNVYKIGNDEFAVPLKTKVNEKTLKKMSNFLFKCHDLELLFTLGASNSEPQYLFISAENALKIAQKRKLKYMLYDEKLKQEQTKRLMLIQKLKSILHKKNVIPYYQCIVDENGKLLKYEALMRLKCQDEIYSPFVFMELIKDAKLYDDFSELMIEKVFNDLKEGVIEAASINVSFIDMTTPETRDLIFRLLKETGVGERITFEILESESISNMEKVKEFIYEIKKYNAKIAIDDFGSGYSNLINILSLSPNYVKIDGSLIKNIDKEEYYEIVKLIVDFSKKFGIKTIAEFVENEDIYKKLKQIGISCYQGYYFASPNL